MDVWRRVFRILQSNFPARDSGESADWPPADWQDEPQRQDDGPPQDPELARYYANLEIPYGSDLDTASRGLEAHDEEVPS